MFSINMKNEAYANSAHDAVLQIGEMLGQLGRLQVVEDERHFATVFDARVADGDVAYPVVRRQTIEVDERRQLCIAGPIVGGQPTLPVFDESRQFDVEVEVNGELSDPEADGVANGPTELVDLTRRQPVVLAMRSGGATAFQGLLHICRILFGCARFVRRLVEHVDALRHHGAQFAVVVAEIVVVIGADARRPRDQHRIGSAVGRAEQRRASQAQVSIIVILSIKVVYVIYIRVRNQSSNQIHSYRAGHNS